MNLDILLLSTPAQYQADNASFITSPNELQKWLDKLPTRDVVQTVSQLHTAIEEFNVTELPSGIRFKLLEQYYNAFESVLLFYDSLRIRQLNISDGDKIALAEDIMWLYLSLAQGYKIIVKQEFDKGSNPEIQSDLLRAMYRSLELISFAFLYAFQSKVAIPPLVFLESHQLYYHARRFMAHESKVRFAGNRRHASSMDKLYKQLMVIIIAKRCPLDAMQFHELYLMLENSAPQSKISNRSEASQSNFCYLIDYMSDDPPLMFPATVSPMSGPSQIVLDIAPTLDAVYKQLSKLWAMEQDELIESEIALLNTFLNTFLPDNWQQMIPTKMSTTQ